MTINYVLGRLDLAAVGAVAEDAKVFMGRTLRSSVGILVFASSLFASGLPALTPDLWDLTYGSTDTFTGFAPTGAVVNSSIPGILLYGAAAPAGAQRPIEFLPFISADVCYSTSCPATTALYPQPNFMFTIGGINFNPYNIVAGTGITSATTDFSFFGSLTYLSSSAVFPSAHGTPTVYTGEDPGGATSYLYFVNADKTVSNVLHVIDGDMGGAFLQGVLLDPPGTLTLDILGFTNPGPNSFVSSPVPEPASFPMFAAGALLLVAVRKSRKRSRLGRSTPPIPCR